MAESRIKDDNYYQVSGWMINRLGLKGVALSVYAIIYGFSQDGENEYTGSVQYLCDFCGGVSKPTIIKALKELVENGLLIRREEIINGVQFNRYKVNLPPVKNLYGGDKEILPEGLKNLYGGGKETLPNNKLDNKDRKQNNNKREERKGSEPSFDAMIDAYANGDEKIRSLLGEWLKVRKAKRAAMTNKAIELNLKKLDRLAAESNLTVEKYLEEVICRGWQAFYKINNYGAASVPPRNSGGNVFLDLYNEEAIE